MPKLPGKRKFKNTKFGSRALRNAKTGGPSIKNKGGSTSSVLTMTVTIDRPKTKRGGTKRDTIIVPTIRQRGGKLVKLKPEAAVKESLKTGDFVRVKGGKVGSKAVAKSITKADKKSRKFSRKLGRIGQKKKR